MPSYDYLCDNCEYKFEQFQSIKADALKKCPKCGKNSLKRLIGAGAGIIFKGSGFYQTDYRSDSYKSNQKSQTPATSTDKKSKESTAATAASDSTAATTKSEPKSKKKSA
jgi:putative FmdB family regulatory protein